LNTFNMTPPGAPVNARLNTFKSTGGRACHARVSWADAAACRAGAGGRLRVRRGASSSATGDDDDDGSGATGAGGSGAQGGGLEGGGGHGGQVSDGCGDGELDAGEACDLGAANGASDSCCDATCALVAAGTVCRAGSGDVCDPDEVCDGAGPGCPDDVLENGSFVCRADDDGDGCDVAELCPGSAGAACPVDGFAAPGTPCGEGVTQPTCNPDACDATGGCLDAPSLADGSLCADGGGDGCCSGLCVASTGGCCGLPAVGALVVDIVESQSSLSGHDLDAEWQAVSSALGYTTTIRQQTFLDNIANLAATDVLIISSGVLSLPAGRVATIQTFLSNGGGVYLQGEYLTTYETNQAFATIVGASGGSFSWSMTVMGDLNPVAVAGCIGRRHRHGHARCHPREREHRHRLVMVSAGERRRPAHPHHRSGLHQGRHAEDQAFMRNVIARLAFATSCT
jgi:hypothetical protein